MKLPGPDHPITITANPKRIRVLADGVVIADTTHALTLKEASYPAVQYVPRSDANMALLARTERTTHCPYKGDASYFSINADGKTLENAIWRSTRTRSRSRKWPEAACFEKIGRRHRAWPDRTLLNRVPAATYGGNS